MGEHVPKFGSKDEEAAFWQKTGLDQLAPDQYEEVTVGRPERVLSTTFAVRFDPATVQLLRRIAKAQGLGPTQLVRAWVLERLRIEQSAGALAERTGLFAADLELTLRRKIIDTLMSSIPAAAEEAMQEFLDRADQQASDLRESV